ncbi:MAG: hypothetical protein FJX60_02825 [Alphaproteobacteria bacterium]|nr:hypothetical protein [Alphaproteobacteria bacterium]
MSLLKRLALLAVVLLPACAAPPPVQLPDMTFTDRPRFLLDVADVQIVDQYQPPFRLPNIEHQVVVPPARAIDRWARDRLVPVGRSGVAIVTIKDARVLEHSLRVTPGVQGVFTKEQAARYEVIVEASIEVRPGSANMPSDAIATARAERSRTVAEGISPNELDRVHYELIEGVMRDLDQQLDTNVRRFLVAYIREIR